MVRTKNGRKRQDSEHRSTGVRGHGRTGVLGAGHAPFAAHWGAGRCTQLPYRLGSPEPEPVPACPLVVAAAGNPNMGWANL